MTCNDGSVYTRHCPAHADTDPCLTMSLVTGRRRTGTIRRGVCTACGHGWTSYWGEIRGYCVWRPNVHGMWTATLAGRRQLAADTLAGLRDIIRHELGVTS